MNDKDKNIIKTNIKKNLLLNKRTINIHNKNVKKGVVMRRNKVHNYQINYKYNNDYDGKDLDSIVIRSLKKYLLEYE